MRLAVAAILAFFLVWPHAAPGAAQFDEAVEEHVTTPGGTRGVLMRPFGGGRRPGVLHLHGSGDTVANNRSILRLFARAGYVALGVEYRQVGSAGADLQEIDDALEFLNGSRYVRRDVIALNGFSRGARVALRVATSRDVRAVSAIAARTSRGSAPTILDEADRLRAPILLQHGTDDPLVPYADSVRLAEKLEGLGRRVEFISYPGADHNNLPWDRVYDRVLRFFRQHLR